MPMLFHFEVKKASHLINKHAPNRPPLNNKCFMKAWLKCVFVIFSFG